MMSEFDAEVVHEELLVIRRAKHTLFGLLKIRLAITEHIAIKPLIHAAVYLYGLGILMGVAILLPCPDVCPNHSRVSLKVVDTHTQSSQRAAHTPESALGVDTAILSVVEGVQLDASCLDKVHHILVAPIKDGIKRLGVYLL